LATIYYIKEQKKDKIMETLELTQDQAFSLLREQLIQGIENEEITDEEFLADIRVLRTVVKNSTFVLQVTPIDEEPPVEPNDWLIPAE
tara:strand:+ start:51 stop:314 length:264 start_codon:yes stop_codon:yes gene_type:complete